ncbi:MAG: phosphoribosylformylglycinamidine cyclo-ligase [Clostridia bacterium]
MAIDYKDAGVDIEAGYETVSRIKEHVKHTYSERVISDIGSFGGLFSIAGMGIEEPVLVAGTDGVGTKLKLAFSLDKHDTIGIDAVAMCVNDIVCQGATPLLFLDYIAVGKLLPEQAAQIVKGVSNGCFESGCALIGGETAEMPGFYSRGEYDVAGFAVGIVDKKNIIDGSKVKIGDAIIGIHSSGFHSNGFSLIRKLIGDDKEALLKEIPGIGRIGLALLTPTMLYVKPVLSLLKRFSIHGIAHITGGGFYENIPRMLKDGQCAEIKISSRKIPPIFDYVVNLGKLSTDSAYNTFNMGIGMTLAVNSADADAIIEALSEFGQTAEVIGRVIEGEKSAVLI